MDDVSEADTHHDWETLEVDEVLALLGTARSGLSTDEAARRLDEHGPNALEAIAGRGPVLRFLDQFRSPLISILLVAAVVTTLIGEYIDSAVIAAVLLLNAVIGFVQESKASRAVEALMGMVAPTAEVERDGKRTVVDSVDVVPGDIVRMESGVHVPADLRIVECRSLSIDESMLTGESVPVHKNAEAVEAGLPVAERTNMAYGGSAVSSGRGRGVVVATGERSQLGSIATAMREESTVLTPLQQRMIRFAKVVAVVVAVSAFVAAIVGVARGEPAADMFMVAVALAVSAIPEGLPVVFTITLAIGVARMARRNAIVRRLPAVEALGSATVIGSDKTGTLTENRMTVRQVWARGGLLDVDVSEAGEPASDAGVRRALLVGVLASEATVDADGTVTGDPTEVALIEAAQRLGIDVEAERAAKPEVDAIPFESYRGYMTSTRRGDEELETFAKGGPEHVLRMCDRMLGRDGETSLDETAVLDVASGMAKSGYRVLAVAWAPRAFEAGDHSEMLLIGLLGMVDPPRRGVADAVAGCRRAGIRVIMITGDHADTALAIASDIGIVDDEGEVITGRDIDELDDAGLDDVAGRVAVFARVTPDHKLRIVHALRRRGEMVAVTGDGVNDAPALRAAEIGIAMGKEGTDVAREAADIVLADDDFSSIYAAVEMGRVTFDNLRKATFFLISSGAAEVSLIVAALALGWPLPLLPAQLLWLNLVTNGVQDVALAFEPGEDDVLDRPPRPPREGVVSKLLLERTLVAGFVIGGGALYMFWWALEQDVSLSYAQSVTLTTIVVFKAFHAGNARSERRSVFRISPVSNPFLLIAVAAAIGLHVLALHAPFISAVLRVEPLPLDAWARAVVVSLSIIFAMELHKWWVRAREARRA
jgi:calcium-translocating P-type ATPase